MPWSDLDIDLGLERPCNLNLLWPLVQGISWPNDPHNPARMLRLRYRPGGSVRRSWPQLAARLRMTEMQVQSLVVRALLQVHSSLPEGMR